MIERRTDRNETLARSPDWPRIHRQIEAAGAALRGEAALSTEAQTRILRQRARSLASPPLDAGAGGTGLEIVEFRLAQEHYAVEASWVGEVLPLRQLTELPCAPRFVAGIIAVHGRVVAVLDLRVFFELERAGLGDTSRVIVLRGATMEAGILADAVLGSSSIPILRIQPGLPTLTGVRAGFLKGVAPGPVVVLDAGKLLASTSLVVNEEVKGEPR